VGSPVPRPSLPPSKRLAVSSCVQKAVLQLDVDWGGAEPLANDAHDDSENVVGNVGQTLLQLGDGLLLPQSLKLLPPGDADALQDGDAAATDDEAVPAPLGDGGEAPLLGSGFEAGQPSKAVESMDVTEEGMVMVVRPEQPPKAKASMDVTEEGW